MTLDPAPASVPGLVVCVGLPSDQIIEIARLLRGQATVLATPDADGARAVLANRAAPTRAAESPRRGLGTQHERFENPGPPDGQAYGRHLPADGDNLAAAAKGSADPPSVPPSPGSGSGGTSPGAAARGLPDAAAGHRGGPRPASGSVPAPHATIPGPPRPVVGNLRAVTDAMRAVTGAVPVMTGGIPMVAPPTLDPLVAGPLLVDLAGREVTALGRRIYLSAREFDLLATLALEAGRVWSFAELTARVWQLPYLGDSDPVTSAVKRLRKRLAPVRDVEVASVRGVGYRLRVWA